MSIVHLWDNSSHVQNLDEKQPFSSGFKLPKLWGDTSNLRILSSSTIGEMMADEECEVMIWPNSFYEGNEELKEQYIFRISEKEGNKIDSITTGNVVGLIGIGNTDIRIHSRFSSKIAEKINDYFLYYMLEKVMSINLFSKTSSSNNSKDQVFDFLLLFFPKLLKEALSQGMYKKYVYHEYNDANVRGVIDINRHIRRNIPANGKIAYRTREFSYDNPMTQLVRHTIEFIRRKPFGKAVLHNDPDTEGCVQQIIQATPTFQPQQRQTVINENLRPVVHPYFTKYAALQTLCLRILRHEKLSYGAANDNKIHGLLIDAAWLWEEYIGRVLAEKGTGLAHHTRSSSSYHLLETSTGKKFQQVIPDYYDEERKLVADAKYIPLHRYDHLDAERAAAVYYKTIMYMYRFNTNVGYLFHPCSQEDVTIVKTNEKLSHLTVEDNTITTSYQIEGREECWLHEVGMVIPQIENDKDFSNFKEVISKVEESFVAIVEGNMNK